MNDANTHAAQRLTDLERLHQIGLALSSEKNRARLVERILLEAKEICRADGGTLYSRTEDEHLRFEIIRTDSLGLSAGGTTGKAIKLPPVPLIEPQTGEPSCSHVVSCAANMNRSINIADAYDAEGFDFSGTKAFDAHNGYRSQSVLTIPMMNQEDRVIGVLQLLNAQNEAGEVIAFTKERQELVEALAAQAAVALDNQRLLSAQRELMEAFIKLIAAAIDAKSPYTGGHCRRVPVLTEMLARAVCDIEHGPFAKFNLTEEEWYELHIAGWLHDCGKITTPVHVMDKATKLETIYDRIATIDTRFAVLRAEIELEDAKQRAISNADPAAIERDKIAKLTALEEDRAFLAKANIGGEVMTADDQARVRAMAEKQWTDATGKKQPLLTEDEVENLVIFRGTLTDDERRVINGHMVETIRMLEALPFPPHLRRVPEYAGGHHEKMDGGGYPKGIYAGDMSVPARIMAIADVFEALTAQDRPYKPGKSLSEAMTIMGFMKKDNHLDPDLFDVFVQSGIYRTYAEKLLPPEQIDDVDEAKLLAVKPKPFELPAQSERNERWKDFLPRYQVARGDTVDLDILK